MLHQLNRSQANWWFQKFHSQQNEAVSGPHPTFPGITRVGQGPEHVRKQSVPVGGKDFFFFTSVAPLGTTD